MIGQIAAETAMSAGGGVAARVLMVGPGQERWIGVHRKVAPDEVDRALVTVLCATSGSVSDAAAHLNVRPEYLERFVRRGRVRRLLAMRGVYPSMAPSDGASLPAYEPPADAASVRALTAYRNPRPGRWRGAWRVEGLLRDRSSRPLVVEAMARIAAPVSRLQELARAFGVSDETLRKWRRAWPEVDAIVRRAFGRRLVGIESRPLTVEQAIDHVEPFLPATSGALDRALRRAAQDGSLVYPVRASSRQLARYVGREDSRGRVLVRRVVHRGHERGAQNTFEWSITQGAEA
ncbi:MAG TPA: hypothetical protein VH062_02375 [Polyangiaceae bacterium]|jgi:hypothetical protein|nr:hypothetical protein [Polyangiaceae bacterium]